ncbi:MAG: MBL fold metallo-hydrolase [Euryarchaeota archaeon]|nr:MBL fold metallo-hydrolase [Euryarchaeota archaeon]
MPLQVHPLPGPAYGGGSATGYLLVSRGEALLVDPGFDDTLGALRWAMERERLVPGDLKRVVLTHTHLNHIRALSRVVEWTGARVCLSATEGFILENYADLVKKKAEALSRAPAGPPRRGPPGGPPPLPVSLPVLFLRAREDYLKYWGGVASATGDVLVRDGESLRVGEESLRVLFTPGHSVGHICLLHPSTGALFSGDHIPGEGEPYLGPGSLEPAGSAVLYSYLSSLRRVDVESPRVLYPAHGPAGGDPRARIRELWGLLEAREGEMLRRARRTRGLDPLEACRESGAREGPALGLALGNLVGTLEKLRVDKKLERRGALYFKR